jgi:hypothetical protein
MLTFFNCDLSRLFPLDVLRDDPFQKSVTSYCVITQGFVYEIAA